MDKSSDFFIGKMQICIEMEMLKVDKQEGGSSGFSKGSRASGTRSNRSGGVPSNDSRHFVLAKKFLPF